MAVPAVHVHASGRLVARGFCGQVEIGNRLGAAYGVGVVLMLVVTEVRCTDPLLVPAISRNRCPAELERQKDEQENGDEFTHQGSIAAARLPWLRQGNRTVGFHC